MKRNKLIGLITMAIVPFFIAGCSSSRNVTSPIPDGSITYQDFYDDLSPYGTWVNYPPYGSVWSPDLESDFRPYATNGYWVYTTYGQTWVSGYSWGWAPFHYGRWIYDDFYGWLWVPGYEWSPAWVTWGYFDNFYCWAPLMPGVNVGIGFGGYRPHSIYWNAVGRRDLYNRHLGTVLIHRDRITNIQNNVNIINNFNHTAVHNEMYSRGPEIADVEKYTGHVAPVRLNEVRSLKEAGVRNDELNVYRPQVLSSQPREFRQFGENERPHPVLNPEERPERSERSEMPRREQMENIRRLPVFRAPERSIPRFRMSEPPMREPVMREQRIRR